MSFGKILRIRQDNLNCWKFPAEDQLAVFRAKRVSNGILGTVNSESLPNLSGTVPN